jgi:DNA-binding XRE family transcriptional regulator
MEGNELRAIREWLGMTQQALAEILGVSRGLVARWESGSQRISLRTAIAVSGVALAQGKPSADIEKILERYTHQLVEGIQARHAKERRPPLIAVTPDGSVRGEDMVRTFSRLGTDFLDATSKELRGAVAEADMTPDLAARLWGRARQTIEAHVEKAVLEIPADADVRAAWMGKLRSDGQRLGQGLVEFEGGEVPGIPGGVEGFGPVAAAGGRS